MPQAKSRKSAHPVTQRRAALMPRFLPSNSAVTLRAFRTRRGSCKRRASGGRGLPPPQALRTGKTSARARGPEYFRSEVMRARLLVAGLLSASWALGDQSVTVGPGFSFSPSTVTVAPGEKVTWVWAGATHSSTSDATSGSDAWDSGLMTTGSFDHVFTTIGAHPYYCVLHGSPGGIGMSGVVQVAPTTPTPTSTATPLPGATAAPSATPAPTLTPFTPI